MELRNGSIALNKRIDTVKRIWFLAYWTICGFLMILPRVAVYADAEVNDISVRVFVPTPTADSDEDPIIRHLLGGQTLELPLVVRGHSERPLDIRARLVQLSVSLGAPAYEEDLEVFSGQVLADGEPLEVNVSVVLPQVREMKPISN